MKCLHRLCIELILHVLLLNVGERFEPPQLLFHEIGLPWALQQADMHTD